MYPWNNPIMWLLVLILAGVVLLLFGVDFRAN